MCDICEREHFPLVQVLVKLLSGRWRWYSVCQECAAAFEEEV